MYYSIKFSPNNKYIAAATDVGRVDVFDVLSNELKFCIYNGNDKAFTCVKWRDNGGSHGTKNVIATTNTSGEISHWHVPTGKLN
jgi:WD40 repeat protein